MPKGNVFEPSKNTVSIPLLDIIEFNKFHNVSNMLAISTVNITISINSSHISISMRITIISTSSIS